jgi:tetratricopeptide (TPR) repeat protein
MRKHLIFALLASLLLASALPALAQDAACDPGVDYEGRAESALLENQFSAAMDAYTCVIEADESNYEAYMGRAEAALLNAALEGDFTYPIALDIQVVYTNDQPLINETIARMSGEIADDEENLGAHALRGYLYWYLGSSEQAMEDYDTVVDLDNNNPFGYLYRGGANLVLGNTAKAAADFARAVRVAPENAGVMGEIGAIYVNSNQPELAIEYLNDALALTPDEPNYLASRARAYAIMEDYDAALEDYSAVIELQPDNPDNYAFRAQLYELMEDYEGAIADYTSALEIDPDYQYGYYGRGWGNINLRNYEAALEDFNRSIELNPTDRWSALGRATSLASLGEMADAADDYLTYVHLMEVTDDRQSATRYGETVTVQMYEGTVATIPFDAEVGDVLTISAESTDGVDTLIVLLGPDGEPLAGHDDIDAQEDNLNSVIEGFEIPEDGEYTLIVTHAGGGSYGTVRVLIEALQSV